MSEHESVKCAALTQNGDPCRNYAQEDDTYCYIHRNYEESAVETTVIVSTDADAESSEVVETESVIAETAVTPPSPITTTAPNASDENLARMSQLVDELDVLVTELKGAFAANGRSNAIYTPARLAALLRDSLDKLPVDVQNGVLENFEGMTKEDLMDPDTWKGLAYMMSYSARFQAEQVVDKVDNRLPERIQSRRMFGRVRARIARHTPDMVKELFATFEDADLDDFLDPDTWKGMWFMMDYAIRDQLDQMKVRVMGEEDDEFEVEIA